MMRALQRGMLTMSVLLFVAACGTSGTDDGGGDGVAAPSALSYDVASAVYRVAESAGPNDATVTGGMGTFSVDPALPAGLALDPLTGRIDGMPTAEAPASNHTVTVTNEAGFAEATISVQVGPPLPGAFVFLAEGFMAEQVHSGASKIGKCARAPDGRLFYTEVNDGDVRVIDPVSGLAPVAYIDLTVLVGGHKGILGLALDPDFQNNGWIYVMATVPGGAGPDKSVILRFTDDAMNAVGTNMVTKVDDLPVGNINNGCDLVFDHAGHLLVSLGDTDDDTTAQADTTTSLAGKILRYDVHDPSAPDDPATIPSDNPDPTSPEWCRGIRNTYCMAIHPTESTLVGGDNGPTDDDELNLLEAGKNYGWGSQAPIPGAEVGRRLRTYEEVIVPTGLAWHDGTAFGAAFANNLFLTSYADQRIRRLEMTGATFTNLDTETVFAEFTLTADDNKPLDIFQAPDGSLYVATFTGIWRIRPIQ